MSSLRNAYTDYIVARTDEGSNKASSYVRALDLLGPILGRSSSLYAQYSDLFSIQSISQIDGLYKYILKQQNLGDAGIFETKYKPS